MVGIVIPTKNNITEFIDCIKSIAKYTHDDYMVYVADTGSTQEVKDVSNTTLSSIMPSNHRFIEFDYYNFAKINNEVVSSHLDSDVDILVFCNNDITIMTDGLIDRMAKAIRNNPDYIGTCGCRLVYPNGTIQHDGQLIRIPRNMQSMVTMSHANVGIPMAQVTKPSPRRVHGNTFALCATERSLFEDIGMLSENYGECFEDVQYNLACKLKGRTNVILESASWAYHHESLSRGKSPEAIAKLRMDYPIICKYIAENYEGLVK